MLLNVQVEEAKRAYETGGREALSAVLAKFQQITETQVVFTDAKGTDLVTGNARPDLLRRQERRRWRLPFPFGGTAAHHRARGCEPAVLAVPDRRAAQLPSSSCSRSISGSSVW